ncbi:MAG: hypothetical protein B7X34_10630 [Acidobacteriia bacterium 12-62-4]|nr:MAG: hypothetical protein B7X34_10630 [Acidobacteriia bacterium 12-62-4]
MMNRRKFLLEAGGGMGALALTSLEAATHHAPKAKRVISLFMSGGVSHMDTFDPKPALARYAGQPLSGKGDVVVRQGHPGPLMPSPFAFRRHGQSGLEVCELFPKIGALCDEYALIRSAFSKSNDHVQAHYALSSGQIRMGFPSLGAWVSYGLGSVNRDLPGYVVLYDQRGGPFGGPANWTSGFMPAAYQGTVFRSSGEPILDLKPPAGMTGEEQRKRLEALRKLNALDAERTPSNTELAARLESYELAYRMQSAAPEAVDLASVKTNHTRHAAATDTPIAGLLTDLKARGLLQDTLVIWHGEFGRMPISQRGLGRDHNPGAMSIWMAGAGIRGGQVIGSSDEFGYKAEEQPVSVHDFHATILHLLGLDHTKLTYRFNGREMRLTDVYGTPVPQLV